MLRKQNLCMCAYAYQTFFLQQTTTSKVHTNVTLNVQPVKHAFNILNTFTGLFFFAYLPLRLNHLVIYKLDKRRAKMIKKGYLRLAVSDIRVNNYKSLGLL